jgi:hypothetical protein
MNTAITVLVKDVYGKRVFYPKCDHAQVFASIAGTTTLTERTLKCIQKLGYDILFVAEEIKL